MFLCTFFAMRKFFEDSYMHTELFSMCPRQTKYFEQIMKKNISSCLMLYSTFYNAYYCKNTKSALTVLKMLVKPIIVGGLSQFRSSDLYFF